jgi:hypothetical protein
MSFQGFTEARHKSGALNDLETRIKNTFNQVKNSRILGGRLLSGVKLKSIGSSSSISVGGVGRFVITVSDYSALGGTTMRIQTNNTYREGTEGSTADWDKGASNSAAASNIATYFNASSANLLATASSATVEVLTGTASVLQNVSVDDKNGITLSSVENAVRVSSSANLNIGEKVRFAPSSIGAPSDALPGVSSILSIETDLAGLDYVTLDGFSAKMRGGLYVYKTIRNNIPGTAAGAKYFIVNQDQPANIFRGSSMGNLALLCDADCTVDMWVF